MKQLVKLRCEGEFTKTPMEVETEADIVGDFAIHIPVDFGNGNWAVSHVPTGMSCCKGIRTKKAALKLVQEMRSLDVDWHSITAESVKKLAPEIASKIKEMMCAAMEISP